MQDNLVFRLNTLRRKRFQKKRMIALLLVLSLLVSLDVFWALRQPGLTLAGDADCKIVEHTHDESCQSGDTVCEIEEHTHTVDCYSDPTKDAETNLDWQKMFEDYPYTGNLATDLAGIAKTQVGYAESKANFETTDEGVRQGYTRYGAWYGAPYGDWSATFVSFCLHYAGADQTQYPPGSGAKAMAEKWKQVGRYASAGEYSPAAGDLVFLNDNTVGIIAQVQGDTLYVIQGDVDLSVQGRFISNSDVSLSGFGIVNNTNSPATIPTEELLDISNGPAVFIFAKENPPRAARFSLRNTPAETDLKQYLTDKNGNYFLTLLDVFNHELPKDGHGNYIVNTGTKYKLTLTCTSPNGFSPGTYVYQFPDDVIFNGGNGEFILNDNTNVGTWEISDDGKITLNFNQNINNRTEVTISATLGVYFPEMQEPIDFDGKITVSVEKPPEADGGTQVEKWGTQGDPNNVYEESKAHQTDPNKIYWTVKIAGNKDSDIPGNVITDQILLHDWSYEHRYTEADMANGLNFGASVIDTAAGNELFWHRWTVLPGDPNLVWNEDGWSYIMPETITCRICGNTITLGNENWTYFIEYTSTPTKTDVAGVLDYSNMVTVDHHSKEGWAGFIQNHVESAIYKSGTLVTDAGGGKFLWELKATLQGRPPDQKAKINWYILDTTSIVDTWGTVVERVENDMKLISVTANYYGKTINVPLIKDATENDPYVLILSSWNSQGNDGPHDTQQYKILCRCECTEDNCQRYPHCWTYGYVDNNGRWHDSSDYCECWQETEDTTFTFTYESTNVDAINKYSGQGYSLRNVAILLNDAGDNISTYAAIPIPGILDKELIDDFSPENNYVAKYRVTVNESKLTLTDGSPLVIRYEMTTTLAFMRGTLVVTSEDADGNVVTLQENVDYTFTYDGTGTALDKNGKPVHVLNINILRPQPVKYTLTYDTAIIVPQQVSEGVKYSNSVSITLWNEVITDNVDDKVYAHINIAAKSYKVELFKKSAVTGELLGGARFGLFNDHGGLITTAETDENGHLQFESNITEGIILREHVLYYIEEVHAPPGYALDDTKHWFCFCDQKSAYCAACETVIDGIDGAIRIPFEQIGKLTATNELAKYSLPATGGPGELPLILVSVMFIITPLVYKFIRRRKRERRGVG